MSSTVMGVFPIEEGQMVLKRDGSLADVICWFGVHWGGVIDIAWPGAVSSKGALARTLDMSRVDAGINVVGLLKTGGPSGCRCSKKKG